MQLSTGCAHGKVILFGEHSVVYGRPALAVPVRQVQVTVTVEPAAPGSGVVVVAHDLGEEVPVRSAPDEHPLALIVRLALAHLGQEMPDWRIDIRSSIPIASGLGSGAAVSIAVTRALAAAAGAVLAPEDVSALAYEVEKLHHGTPSGVDNTVIAHEQPVYFVRGRAPETFHIGQPFWLAIADSGVKSPTKVAVGAVRHRWEQDRAGNEALFDAVAGIVEQAREAISGGRPDALGPLMDRNHALLMQMGVSSPELESLVAAARQAGAAGAKLSGAGMGGNAIALVTPVTAGAVEAALHEAGARRVIVTRVE